jgi:chaperonin GroES
MKVQPLHDWAVIHPSESAEKTAGGLYIPDTAKDKPQEGIVEAIGPGAFEEEKRQKKKGEKKERRFVPTVVKPGDHVVYGRYAGQTYNIDGEERVLVRERDILGIFPVPRQLPATTASAGETALIKSAADAPAAAKKPAVKTKKAEPKAVKKQGLEKKSAATPSTTKTARKVKAKKAGKKK